MKSPESLEEWFPTETIERVRELLDKRFTSNPVELEDHLKDMATVQGNIAELFSEAQSLVAYSRQAAMLDKRARALTAAERKYWIDGQCRRETQVRDLLEGFGKALKDKIILGEVLSKGINGEVVHRQ